ncbi:MAG: hypothetical protein CEE40_12480 [Chloroflexi bacterium B3_Chlor]|nr:MAG: hypothetical protein CEE40_12480 [Chloroflexi bacterium B3_Chlor]
MAGEKKCPECGYKNEPQATFCGNCGNPLRAPGSAAPPPPSTLPEEVGAASRPRVRHHPSQKLVSQLCPLVKSVQSVAIPQERRCIL